MIAKSEFSDLIVKMALILEKQVGNLNRKESIDFLEALSSSEDKTLPVIILGNDGELLFKDVSTNETTLVDFESFSKIRERISVSNGHKYSKVSLKGLSNGEDEKPSPYTAS